LTLLTAAPAHRRPADPAQPTGAAATCTCCASVAAGRCAARLAGHWLKHLDPWDRGAHDVPAAAS
jgi:hypothetical protein